MAVEYAIDYCKPSTRRDVQCRQNYCMSRLGVALVLESNCRDCAVSFNPFETVDGNSDDLQLMSSWSRYVFFFFASDQERAIPTLVFFHISMFFFIQQEGLVRFVLLTVQSI